MHLQEHRRSLRRLVIAALFVGSLTACDTAHPGGASSTPAPEATAVAEAKTFPDGVTSIACDIDAQGRPEERAVIVLADPTWRVGGWSHVNGVGSFATVAQPVATYRISAEKWLPDASCGGAKTLATVLAKKTFDWDRQHANGIEASFPSENLVFGDVTDIVLVMRLDPTLSSMPTAAELAAAYGDLLSTDQLAQLDASQLNLELTLFGEGATADQPFMNAGTIIAVDPDKAADGWLRVQVPRADLTFYTEDDYVRTEVQAEEWAHLQVQGLRINPETAGGLTARHFLLDDFDVRTKPELFKEMGITFAVIEVGRS